MSGLLLSTALGLAMAQGSGAGGKPPVPPLRSAPPPVLMPSPPAPPLPPPPAPARWDVSGRPQPVRRSFWFTSDDYPAAALRNEEEGTVVVRLDVTAAGRVDNCTILSTSGSSSLDSATCRIFRVRARFRPGRDARGEAIASSHVDRVRWQLPDTTSIPFEPAIATVSATLAGERMVACEPLDSPVESAERDDDDEDATLATEACGIAFPRRQPVPAAIGQGRSRVRVTIEIERDGQPKATGIAQPGRPLFAATAAFQVPADGSLAECRARVTVRPRDRRLSSFDLCALLQRPTLYLFEESTSDGRPRQGRLTITVRESEAAR